MKPCPQCDSTLSPVAIRYGKRKFLATCQSCGAISAYETSLGLREAFMRVRRSALAHWDIGLIVMPDHCRPIARTVIASVTEPRSGYEMFDIPIDSTQSCVVGQQIVIGSNHYKIIGITTNTIRVHRQTTIIPAGSTVMFMSELESP